MRGFSVQGGNLHPDHYGLGFYLPLNDLGSGQVDITVRKGTGTMTFARTTTATTIDSTGAVISVSSGIPRSLYNPATLKYCGFLGEMGSTNLALQSAFASGWTVQAGANNSSAVIRPDGGTAIQYSEDNTTGAHRVYQSFTKAASALPYTFSCWFKASGRTWACLCSDDASANNGAVAYFDLTNGVVGSIGKGSVYTNLLSGTSSTIQAFPNGWYRCSLSYTSTAGTSMNCLISTATGDAANINTFTGINASSIYIFGGQVEQASTASSYIPTTTVAVNRNTDNLSISSSGILLDTLGTAYCEFTATNYDATHPPRLIGTNQSTRSPITIDGTSTNSIYDGSSNANSGSLTILDGNVHKCLTTWDSVANYKQCWTDTTTGGSTTYTVVSPTTIYINSGAANASQGGIKEVRIFTRRFNITEAAAFTR